VSRPRLVCITGLTASGKSALALELAEALGAELLSVDSMQVHRGFDIGTAKPTSAERARVRHHGIDLVGPEERYSAASFAEYARAVIEDARTRGTPILAVGGTGLYLRALLHGLAPLPPADNALRARLRAKEEEAPGSMHARLQEVDPVSAERLAPQDLIRVERAIEVSEATGLPMSQWQQEHGFAESPYDTLTFAIRWSRADIRERIASRVDSMLRDGWLDEVRDLLDSGVSRQAPAMFAIGYREIAAHLAGESDLPATRDRIVTATRRFAKRQATWFNRQPSIRWVDPMPGLSVALLPEVRAFFEGS
jgi:tRNA dimethylallyltransferase